MSFLSKFKISVLEQKQPDVQLTLDQMLEAQFTESIVHSSMPITLINVKGKVAFANQAAKLLLKTHESAIKTKIADFKADALIGHNIETFIHPQLYAAKQGSHLVQQSYELQFNESHFSLKFVPLYRPEGQHIGTMVEWVDDTERKKTAAIIRSIDQSQAVIEFTPTGIIKRECQLSCRNGV